MIYIITYTSKLDRRWNNYCWCNFVLETCSKEYDSKNKYLQLYTQNYN